MPQTAPESALGHLKYLPLPTIDRFRKHMKWMNIKHYDDIILYSQMPRASAGECEETDIGRYRHLVGIYRAQYLFEVFGHKGNIYIMENYDP